MVTKEFAEEFTNQWLDARNDHNIDDIINQYTDDCIVDSPMAVKFVPESNGKLMGKANLRTYWENGLQFLPDLDFEILDVMIGIESLTIYYLNIVSDKKASEVVFLNEENKVYRSSISYSEEVFDNFY